jgi:hypothetical protein
MRERMRVGGAGLRACIFYSVFPRPCSLAPPALLPLLNTAFTQQVPGVVVGACAVLAVTLAGAQTVVRPDRRARLTKRNSLSSPVGDSGSKLPRADFAVRLT